MEPVMAALRSAQLQRARIVELMDDDSLVVELTDGTRVRCDRLHTAEWPAVLETDDLVLVWLTDPDDGQSGVLLGRIGPGRRTGAGTESLTIEATKSLTLRVGDGSITIRDDGRILIRGRDLVSHAKRNNRIRGGSVTIN
jgi:hypothetical protein